MLKILWTIGAYEDMDHIIWYEGQLRSFPFYIFMVHWNIAWNILNLRIYLHQRKIKIF